MQLFPIETGYFKLDGGAMFGVVPKTIWNRSNPADENNLCTFAMRSLLIQQGNRLILIDTGIGNKQSEKFFSYYYLHGEATLMNSIRKAGFHPDEITDVVLTHLHFDHVGGGIYRADNGELKTTFKNAKYWSNAEHWQWATEPNAREKASFLTEKILPLEASGQLHFVKQGNELGEDISFLLVNGHTESQMIPHIQYKGKTLVFMADLLPSAGHLPLPYVMGYDTRPLLTLGEKEKFLNQAIKEDFVLFMQHDSVNQCINLKQTDKGPRLQESFTLNDF